MATPGQRRIERRVADILTAGMRRREFILAVAVAALLQPLAAARAGDRVRLVAMLMPFDESDPEALIRVATFQQRLQELGWAVGRDLRIEARWAGTDRNLTRSYARELIGTTPDVIL